jgi:hypothetical protein
MEVLQDEILKRVSRPRRAEVKENGRKCIRRSFLMCTSNTRVLRLRTLLVQDLIRTLDIRIAYMF